MHKKEKQHKRKNYRKTRDKVKKQVKPSHLFPSPLKPLLHLQKLSPLDDSMHSALLSHTTPPQVPSAEIVNTKRHQRHKFRDELLALEQRYCPKYCSNNSKTNLLQPSENNSIVFLETQGINMSWQKICRKVTWGCIAAERVSQLIWRLNLSSLQVARRVGSKQHHRQLGNVTEQQTLDYNARMFVTLLLLMRLQKLCI